VSREFHCQVIQFGLKVCTGAHWYNEVKESFIPNRDSVRVGGESPG